LFCNNEFTSSKMSFTEDLARKGYAIIENVLSPEEVTEAKTYFQDWLDSNEQIKRLHDKIDPHGIFKYLEAGHQKHAWFIRTRPAVQNIFKTIWDTDELVVSFDGSCWLSSDLKKRDNIWTHTDQSPLKKGLKCYQALVALTDNIERTLVVYEGSHLLHEEYGTLKNITSNKDWLLIEHDYLNTIAAKKKILPVKAGSMVIWDSRTFHQNQYGTKPEERIVQYVSYLPRLGLSKKMYEKRMKYFLERRTTSHWAYPVKVNAIQPQTYGSKEREIDYSTLQKPDLSDLLEEIYKLI